MTVRNKFSLFPSLCSCFLVDAVILFSSAKGYCQATDPGILERQLRESRPEFAPPPPEVVPDIKVEDSRELIDAGAGPKFFVREIKITGNTLISTEELVPILDVGEGEEMTLGILSLYANEVASVYALRGYFLARAFIPAQEIINGTVIMQVVEGKLGQIEVTGNKLIASNQYSERMISLRDEEVLNESALERVLLELNSLMGVQVKSVLRPGELPGTTDLVLQVQEERPYTVSMDVDNFGSQFTGPIRVGGTATYANLFRLGDQFSFRVVQSEDGQDFLNPSFLFPVTNRGDTVKVSFTHSEHDLGKNLTNLRAGGKSQIFSVEGTHPIHRSRSSQLFAQAGLQFRNYINEQLGNNTSDDRFVNVYLSAAGNYTDPYKGRNFFSAKVQKGFTEADNEERLNSRTNGRGDVIIFSSNLTRYQNASILHEKIPGFFIMKAGGQFATARALSPDLTAVGGMGTVRGFAISQFSGDHGYTFSLEYNFPFPSKFPLGPGLPTLDKFITILGFIDHGAVFVEDAEPGEDHRSITGAGFGLKFNLPAKDKSTPSASFSIVYGAPVMSKFKPSDNKFGTYYLSGVISY